MTHRHRMASNLAQMAQMGAARYASGQDGIVSSYDPKTFAVKVRLQPSDTETGWLPIRVLQSGNGWGVYAAPHVGDACSVDFQEGDGQVGRCTGFWPNDEDQPPEIPEGEMWLVHKSGSYIKLQTDGGIRSKGPWVHEGTFHATQAITSEADITDHAAADGSGGVSMKKHRDAYNAAKYPGVQAGSGTTGTTDHPAT